MKIIFVSKGIYPFVIGGEEIFNYYIIEALKKHNKIGLITHYPLNLSDIEVYNPIKLKPVKVTFNVQVFLYILFHSKPDYIVVSYSSASWVNWVVYPLLKVFLKVKYIILVHGGAFQEWRPQFPYKVFFKHASHVIGVSTRACQEYRQRSRREVIYIPPLLPFEPSTMDLVEIRKKYNIPADSKVLLYVGSIKRIKGTQTLVDAFMGLDKDFIESNNLYLIIAGDGEMRKELENKSFHSEYAKRVKFLGNVIREEIPKLYKLGDIYIISSHYENLSISMLEAMFNSKPIIAANSMGIHEVLQNNLNALLYETENAADLACKIKELIMNKPMSEGIAAEANNTYKLNYSFQTTVELFQNILKSLGK